MTHDADRGTVKSSSLPGTKASEPLDRGVDLRQHLTAMRSGWRIWVPVALLIALATFLWTAAQPKTYATTGTLRVAVAGATTSSSDLASQVAAVALSDRVLNTVPNGMSLRKTATAKADGTIVTVTVRGSDRGAAEREVNSIINHTVSIYAADPSSVSGSLSSTIDTITQEAQNGTKVTGRLTTLSDDLRNGRFSQVSLLDHAYTDPDSKQPDPVRNAVIALVVSGIVAAEVVALLLQRLRRRKPSTTASHWGTTPRRRR